MMNKDGDQWRFRETAFLAPLIAGVNRPKADQQQRETQQTETQPTQTMP